MKRFVVAVNNASREQKDAITKMLSENQYGYWHWFQDFWLLTSSINDINSAVIRDEIQKVASGVHCFVLAVDGDPNNWAAYGKKEQFDWLHKTWSGC